MKTLLDTHVLSELLRAAPAPAVLSWFSARAAGSLFVSTVTQAEMLLGARLLPAGRRRQQLQQALDTMFSEDFGTRLLPFDADAAVAYAEVVARRRSAGRPVSQFDAQIAAIAISRECTLATRNVGDFEGCGVEVLDPWSRVT